MKKYIERILLTILCATTILLGLTFWLNTNFGFNLFSATHWHELSVIQAHGESISGAFYLSIGIAILLFIICLNIIYRPKTIKITPPVVREQKPDTAKQPESVPIEKSAETETKAETIAPAPTQPQISQQPPLPPHPQQTPVQRPFVDTMTPPKLYLNLPKNMAQIAAMQHANQVGATSSDNDKFDPDLEKIFTENNFLVKKNPTISGLKLNLFAIGANEIVWMGGVNCDTEKLKSAIEKLESVFSETLEDIPITVNAFVLDTLKRYDSDSRIRVFHDLEDLRKYISENPAEDISDSDHADFNAYSDYIDTVLTLLYKT